MDLHTLEDSLQSYRPFNNYAIEEMIFNTKKYARIHFYHFIARKDENSFF